MSFTSENGLLAGRPAQLQQVLRANQATCLETAALIRQGLTRPAPVMQTLLLTRVVLALQDH
ncbi:MAG: hypothetical protein AB1511_06405 [Deinococcota bacterium]